ncbi:CAP domain-containing protein [Micromonospora sp. WMMD735]|uniref:CAP domain-containing protein n=1 Tax=Micromonospora sp. WMMD735 TaxID=3404130 RepID=UPI003B9625D2
MLLFRGRRSVTPARKRPVEATGVYGWTDPNDPDAAYRRPQPSTDDPAWLTDRPAPRSAYLFGDDPAVDAPAQPGPAGADAATGPAGGTPPAADRWTDAPDGQPWQGGQTGWQDAPTGRWNAGPAGQWDAVEQTTARPDDRNAAHQEDAWRDGRWSDGRDEPAGTRQEDRAGAWQDDRAGEWQGDPAGAWRDDRTGAWQDEQGDQSGAWRDEHDRTGAWQDEQGDQSGAWRDEHDRAGAWQSARDDRPGRWPDEQAASWRDGQPGTWPAGHGEPDQPWHGEPDQPWQGGPDDRTGVWQGQPAAGPDRQEPWPDRPDGSWSGDGADRWAQPQAGPWHDGVDRAVGPDAPRADAPAGPDGRQPYPAAVGPVRADLRDATAATPTVGPVDAVAATGRTRRRSRRPVLIGGAAAAATLVVSLGIGAVLLPDDDGNTDRAALDEPVATAPVITGTAPSSSAPASPSASPSPSPTSASPSPSRTATPTPTPSRTQAASRQTARGGSGSVAPAAPPTTRAAVSGGGGSQTQQVVDLVNAERAKAGCAAVTVDAKLTLAAQQHSQDQADHKTMTHTGSDGSNAGQRLDRAGYAWRTYGENVAWNQPTPAAVMDAWMNSPGHRANILNCAFTEIGVGVANGNGPYWTQDFAAPR